MHACTLLVPLLQFFWGRPLDPIHLNGTSRILGTGVANEPQSQKSSRSWDLEAIALPRNLPEDPLPTKLWTANPQQQQRAHDYFSLMSDMDYIGFPKPLVDLFVREVTEGSDVHSATVFTIIKVTINVP